MLKKVYMALFICFASKAVHIDTVTTMTTPPCIAALRSLNSRRGCPPTQLNTDNGSNFLGAKSEPLAIQEVLKANHADSLKAEAAGLNMI